MSSIGIVTPFAVSCKESKETNQKTKAFVQEIMYATCSMYVLCNYETGASISRIYLNECGKDEEPDLIPTGMSREWMNRNTDLATYYDRYIIVGKYSCFDGFQNAPINKDEILPWGNYY